MTKAGSVEVAVRDEFVVPGIGQVIDRNEPADCAMALAALDEFRRHLAEVEADLQRVVLADAEEKGKKTVHYGGFTAEVSGGTGTVYDPEYIEAGLRKAGMPEARIAEIVRETVERKVMAGPAKQAASANKKYAGVIRRGSSTVEKHKTVKVKPR